MVRVRRVPSVLVPLLIAAFVLTAIPAAQANASPLASTAPAATAKCSGLFIGEIVAFDGVQRIRQCTFKYDGNPIKVSATDLGVSIPPPAVVVAVVAFPGFPPRPKVIAQCVSFLTCRDSGKYTPTGPLGNTLVCVFGAISVRVTVEVIYRFDCSSGATGGILPLP